MVSHMQSQSQASPENPYLVETKVPELSPV